MSQTTFDFGVDPIPAKIRELIASGALFVINHSAGKDSQAMTIKIRELVPDDQLLVIHADLGRVEWPGNVEHVQSTIGDLPLIVCRSTNRTFMSLVRDRGMFPSPQQRGCTSELKRNPIEREIRRYLKANPRFGGQIVNCMGLRAQESSNRAKAIPFKRSDKNSIAGREWYVWLPIHEMTIDEVWATIASAGQTRHPAYDLGMSRLSCSFCIMANKSDLCTAARARPDLYREYVEMEREIGQTMFAPVKGVKRTLEEITGIFLEDAA